MMDRGRWFWWFFCLDGLVTMCQDGQDLLTCFENETDEDLVPLSTACAVLDPQFAAVQYHHHHALTAHHGRAVRHEATIDT